MMQRFGWVGQMRVNSFRTKQFFYFYKYACSDLSTNCYDVITAIKKTEYTNTVDSTAQGDKSN